MYNGNDLYYVCLKSFIMGGLLTREIKGEKKKALFYHPQDHCHYQAYRVFTEL